MGMCPVRAGRSVNGVKWTQCVLRRVHSSDPCRLCAGPGSPHALVCWTLSSGPLWIPDDVWMALPSVTAL